MGNPPFVTRRRVITASMILEAIGEDLCQIKKEDGLTLADIGKVFGKSDDQAGKYCIGSADMGVVSYAMGRQAWNGRFTGSLDRLIEDRRASETSDRTRLGVVLRAAMAIASSIEADEEMDAQEVRQHRACLEDAKAEIDALLSKLAPRAVA